jgi:hypothetical protein
MLNFAQICRDSCCNSNSTYHSKPINISHLIYTILPPLLMKSLFWWSHDPLDTDPWPHPHDGVNWWFLVMEQNTRAWRKFAVLKQHTSLTAYPTHSMIMWLHTPRPLRCPVPAAKKGRNTEFILHYHQQSTIKLNPVTLVRKRATLTERPTHIGEVSANSCG